MLRVLYSIKYLLNIAFLIFNLILILFYLEKSEKTDIYPYIYIKSLQMYLSIIFIECNKDFFKEFWKFLKKYKEINIGIILIGYMILIKKNNINEVFKIIDMEYLLPLISINIILYLILKLFFQAITNKEDKLLYESRKKILEVLKNFLYNDKDNCILIDGKWGIGKLI